MKRLTTVRLESFVAAIHPLGPIRNRHSDTRASMDTNFSAMCKAHVKGGRLTTAPDKQRGAMLLRVSADHSNSGAQAT